MQLIGENSTVFASQLEVLVKCGTRLPLNLISWAKMPEVNRYNVWKEIQENTDAPDEYRSNCLMKVGDLWKKWKANVKKKYFSPFQDDPKELAQFPSDCRLRPDQWDSLVSYWQLEEVKTQSQDNKEHQEELEYIHITGKTSFANIRYRMKEMGENVSRARVFCRTRQCPDKKPRHEDTEEVMSEMKRRLDEVPTSEQTEELEEAIFTDVLGKEKGHGRV